PELDAEVLLPWLNRTRRWEAYHTLQAAGIPCAPIPELAEVLASPQLVARDALREIAIDGRPVRVPGPPARESALGGARPARRDDPRWRPGALRIVELSMGWAGPLAGYALAALGADVVKVEGPERFDWWRGARAPGEDTQKLYERSH